MTAYSALPLKGGPGGCGVDWVAAAPFWTGGATPLWIGAESPLRGGIWGWGGPLWQVANPPQLGRLWVR
jgi:hypothetical protein